jgi:glucose-6-phosphate isomerase
MITVDFENSSARKVGQDHGISRPELDEEFHRSSHFCRKFSQDRQAGRLPFASLPYDQKLADSVTAFARAHSKKFENFVVLGIGGSALGGIALQTALCDQYYNALPAKSRGGWPRVFFVDNVDPEEFSSLLKFIDVGKTMFNVISKSGETAETTAGFLIALEAIRSKSGKNWKKNFVMTTDPQKGSLRTLVTKEGLESFEIPHGVGGRFSVLSSVGLLPAAFCGINVSDLLAGARWMDKKCAAAEPASNPAYVTGLVNYYLDVHKKKHIVVMMPYSEALRDVADWFRQLWAESLGKKMSLNNRIVHTGQTPVKALGTTDQHSQIQLFNEGPNDKLVCFLEVEKFRADVKMIDAFKGEENTAFLGGKTLSRLLNAEKKGTEIALTKSFRPNYTIRMKEISEKSVGALLYMLEVATAFGGMLYNVNAFDQPGVEAGKQATFALMGRHGYENLRRQIEPAPGQGGEDWTIAL